MHYEKKGINKKTLKMLLGILTIPLLISVIFILILYIYTPSEFWWPIKFIDIINAFAQVATAGAFFLAIHQYRKNKESERQKVLIEEARNLINAMKLEADSYSNVLRPTLKKAMSFMSNMINHAGNFDAIFKETNEGIHKAVVRMHWQGMYFGELTHAVQKFNERVSFTDFSVPHEDYVRALMHAKYAENNFPKPAPIFLEYIRLQFISNLSNVKKHLKIHGEDHLTMHLFESVLFNDSALSDHLYGTFNRIDIRVRSPLIAVINESFISHENFRERDSFKAFWPIPADS